LREMVVPVVSGLTAGAIVALVLGRTIQAFLFRVSATDPLTFVAIGALLLLVAACAVLIPARRAANLDPVQVLTSE